MPPKPPPGKQTSSSAPGSAVSTPVPTTKAQESVPGLKELQKITQMLTDLQMSQNQVQMTQNQMLMTQQEMLTTQNRMEQELAEMKGLKKDVEQCVKKIGVLEEGAAGISGEVREIKKSEAETDNWMMKMELERMSFYLRLQNFEEEEGENLKDILSTVLSEFIQKERDQIWWDIDQVYRVNSTYARLHNVPREIHIKFLRRSTRDEVLRGQRGGGLTYKGKTITILKQIPRKIREKRKKFSSLSKKLYNKGVPFRWLIPQGLLIHWKGEKIKITNQTEAEAFMQQNRTFLEEEELLGAVGGSDPLQDLGGATALQDDDGGAMLKKLRSYEKK